MSSRAGIKKTQKGASFVILINRSLAKFETALNQLTMTHVFESIADHPVAWGESDIDEMLAEYLLDDAAEEETGVTHAFNK